MCYYFKYKFSWLNIFDIFKVKPRLLSSDGSRLHKSKTIYDMHAIDEMNRD